jgi:sigma-B regulation protein RsbU (phosphoserine phosphatase)
MSTVQLQPEAGGGMAAGEQTYLRTELGHRHDRLQEALRAHPADSALNALLGEVDAALERMHTGSYGLCDVCHEPIEADRLLADPLTRVCLGDLSVDEQRALERDLTLAATIQRGLLPRPDFAAKGWHVKYHYAPAGLVSGDYCDLLETPAGLLFMLGDVSGKGVAASMLMSHLHATFRSLANSDLALGAMVEAANRIFAESTMADQYATLVVGRASDDGAVELVSAGHLPVLHLSSGEARSQHSTGVPLGMFAAARFPALTLSLGAGDGLLLYTDGLTEARNIAGEEYTFDRVKALATRHSAAAPHELISHCLADVTDFSRGTKPFDDLTLLAIRRAN